MSQQPWRSSACGCALGEPSWGDSASWCLLSASHGRHEEDTSSRALFCPLDRVLAGLLVVDLGSRDASVRHKSRTE
jgi:hypothetical protein